MKSLSQNCVVGEPLESAHRQIATRIAAASRGALSPDDVVLTFPPPHVEADLAFECFPLARAWRQNPTVIAETIAEALAAERDADDVLAAAEAAGPYVNLRLDRRRVLPAVLAAATEPSRSFGASERQAGLRVMVEYVSPNTNKPLHLGHIRNAVLGRSVARLIAAQGAEVFKTDIINDRGIHIAKSMVAYRRWGDGETPRSTGEKGDHFVGRYYVRFEQALQEEKREWLTREQVDPAVLETREGKKVEDRFVAESELMGEAREVLQRWEAGDEEARALWRTMDSWVYDGFDETYALLGIDFDKHYYESDIYGHGREIVLDALARGVFRKAPNGAVFVPLSEHGKLQNKVLLRANGTGLYVTQDIYLATLKFEEFHLDRSIYTIGSEQDYYMQQLFMTLRLLGRPWAESLHHLSYGMVYLPEGKMKSREGKVVDADTLVDEMRELAAQALRERWPELEGEVLRERALAIALAAMTFHFLIVGRDTEVHFDPASSLAFEGKTGPYLQYTHARMASILRKAGEEPAGGTVDPEAAAAALTEELEWKIASGILLFPSIVTESAEELDPSRLATYLIDLAQTFNTFYHEHPVLQAEEPVRTGRLRLVHAFQRVLHDGLELLGITPLHEM